MCTWSCLQLVAEFLFLLFAGADTRSYSHCGGRVAEPRGLITTPNFPGPFEVPIKCRWVIDASDLPAANGSIIVYLAQLYVYKGLSFTEYAYYESESLSLGGTRIQEITESNVFEFRWLKTFRPILVVDFTLDRLEGNHVRVLNDLLDVYGFNFTYEMTSGPTNPESCSVRDCSYSGNCFVAANYSTFWCNCFAGFAGSDCSTGPLCLDDQRQPICQNGATCRQVGAEAVRCHCAEGFAGSYCEMRTSTSESGPEAECAEGSCVLQCSFDGIRHRGCDCRNGTKITTDRSRFECRIKLTNVTAVRAGLLPSQGNLESVLVKQIGKYLKNANISSVEELKILSVTSSSEVVFHFFGNTDDGDKIRESFNRLVQRRRLGDISLESTHFTFQQKPALKLQSLRLSQANDREVRLGDQLIVSCVAQGSYNLTFTWYKDGMFVNESKATREIWLKHLPNDGSDQHTSLLGIDKSTALDAGRYTCQVVDWGIQQCKSLLIEVREEPNVRVVPMSATIEKGNAVQLKCLTPNMRSIGIGFGWSKNRALLKLEPGSEVWEDLFPAGSILKITNAQKSAIYTCNVAQRSMAVRVEVVNRTLVPICGGEKSWGIRWPDTAPGLEALLDCPRYFIGRRVSRLCSMKDATTPEWQLPDFSGCLYEPLFAPYMNFQSLTLGYQNATGSGTVRAYWGVLRSRSTALYPGEGDRIVALLSEVERYLNSTREIGELANSADSSTRIVNLVIENDRSMLNEQPLSMMQQLTRRNLMYWAAGSRPARLHLGLSAVIADVVPLEIDGTDGGIRSAKIPDPDNAYPIWYKDEVTIRLQRENLFGVGVNEEETPSGISIVYKNLSAFMPSMYVTELHDGTDLEYRINSRVVTVDVVFPGSRQASGRSKVSVDLELRHIRRNGSGHWNLTCGTSDFAGFWSLDSCLTEVLPGGGATRCICPRTGTFAVFLTARAVRVALAKKQQATLVVIVGCGSCLLQCLATFLILGSHWWTDRSWLNFLKLQCCAALIGAMAIFISAAYRPLVQSSFALVAITLEALLLVGMSAPISQALIVYAELTQVRPGGHLQPTVIAVITGVPVLTVLATELANRSTGSHHESWWLIAGSGMFNVFVICATIMLSIFVLLHIGIVHKAQTLVAENVLKKETVGVRIRLLRRAAVTLCAIISMEVSSIFYANTSSAIVHYIFATVCALLGFVVIVAYVINGEIHLTSRMFDNFKWKSKTEDDNVSEPVKVSSSRSNESSENDVCSQSLRLNEPAYLEARGTAAGSTDCRRDKFPSSEMPATTYKSFALPSSGVRFHPEIRTSKTDNVNLENYNTSPKKYQEVQRSESGVGTIRGATGSAGTPNNYPYDCYGGAGPLRDFNRSRGAVETGSKTGHQQGKCNPVSAVSGAGKVLCNAEVESRINAAVTIGTLPDVTLALGGAMEMEMEMEMEMVPVESVKIREQVNAGAVRVTGIPDIANTSERKQPDGEEKAPEIVVGDNCESNAAGMLDRISHDLDYLLNRKHRKDEAL